MATPTTDDRRVTSSAPTTPVRRAVAQIKSENIVSSNGKTAVDKDELDAVNEKWRTDNADDPSNRNLDVEGGDTNADTNQELHDDNSAPTLTRSNHPAPDAPTTAPSTPTPVRAPVRMAAPVRVGTASRTGVPLNTRPITPVTFKIETIGEEDDKPLKTLFYGAPGVGKTFLAGTALDIDEMRDVLWIDAESGRETLKNRKNLDFVKITQYAELARIYDFLRLHCRAKMTGDLSLLARLEIQFRQIEVPDGTDVKALAYPELVKLLGHQPRQYNTVVGDSLSELNRYCMYMLQGITADWSLEIPPDAPEWVQAGDLTRLLVRQFRNLPMHVIFVCAVQEKEDDKKIVRFSPSLPGKLSGEVQAFFDCVGYLVDAPANDDANGGRARRLYIAPGAKYQAKNRFVNHPDVRFLDNPSMTDILNLSRS